MLGDYFLVGDLDQGVLSHLRNVQFTPEAVEAALSDVNIENHIMNLSNQQFIDLLFKTSN